MPNVGQQNEYGQTWTLEGWKYPYAGFSDPMDTPTPSGSNFGDTVYGQQAIYDEPGGGGYWGEILNNAPKATAAFNNDSPSDIPIGSNNNYPWGRDPNAFNSDSEWAKQVLADNARSAAKWAGSSGSGGSGGSSSGGYYGTSGTSLANTYAQKAAIDDYYRPKKTITETIAPEGVMPSFEAPARYEDRLKALVAQKSAAGLRALRSQIQKAMGQGYRNANVKRMTLRDALAGYGQGLANVMTGAQTAATNEYNQEYGTEYDTATKNWQNKVNEWLKGFKTVTTTE
jgi:hypothetical protein